MPSAVRVIDVASEITVTPYGVFESAGTVQAALAAISDAALTADSTGVSGVWGATALSLTAGSAPGIGSAGTLYNDTDNGLLVMVGSTYYGVVNTSMANQPNGYLQLNSDGEAVGPLYAGPVTSAELAAMAPGAGVLLFNSDTHEYVGGDGSTVGGVTIGAVSYIGTQDLATNTIYLLGPDGFGSAGVGVVGGNAGGMLYDNYGGTLAWQISDNYTYFFCGNGSLTVQNDYFFLGAGSCQVGLIDANTLLIQAGSAGVILTDTSFQLPGVPLFLTAQAAPATPSGPCLYVDSGDSNKLKFFDGTTTHTITMS